MLRNSINLIAAGMVSVGLYSAFPTTGSTVGPVAALLSCTAWAGVPNEINHQGVVSVNGVRFNGNGVFYFSIVDVSSGLNVWTNDGSQLGQSARPNAGLQIAVSNGAYSIRLGDVSVPGMRALPSGVFSVGGRSLRIWFNSQNGHGIQQLIPDQPLAASAYAHNAAGLPGEVRLWAGAVASVPAGWMPCDGRVLPRSGESGYPELFAAIGTIHGPGDGNSTFNLPDMRNRVPMGVFSDVAGIPMSTVEAGVNFGDGSTRGPTHSGGAATHILNATQLPMHTHTGTTGFGNSAFYRTIGDGGNPATSSSANHQRGWQSNGAQVDRTNTEYSMRNHTHSFTTDSNSGGGNAPHSNLDPYLAVVYIISTGR